MIAMPERMPLRQFINEVTISDLSPEDCKQLMTAVQIVIKYHWGQTRLTGAQYEEHLFAAGLFMIRLGLPIPVVIATIGHDLLEDTRASREIIVETIGDECTGMIEAVTEDDKEDYFASIGRYVVDTGRWEVLFIKMVDRLHNLVTIYAANQEKQLRKCEETLGPLHELLKTCRKRVPKEWRGVYDDLHEEIMQTAEAKKKELLAES